MVLRSVDPSVVLMVELVDNLVVWWGMTMAAHLDMSVSYLVLQQEFLLASLSDVKMVAQ